MRRKCGAPAPWARRIGLGSNPASEQVEVTLYVVGSERPLPNRRVELPTRVGRQSREWVSLTAAPQPAA